MRIATVSTSDYGGGAERAAWQHFDGYRRRGHESWLVVGEKKSDDDGVITQFESPQVDYRPYGRPSFRAAIDVARRVDRRLGLEEFRHPYTRHLLELRGAAPDIVHLHNLHGGYFDVRVLPEISARVPVFFSSHDMWMLTGHCAHAARCERWRVGCGSCPDLGAQPAVRRDATRFNLRRKAELWEGSRIRILTPCEWMRERIEASALAPAIAEMRIVRTPVDLSEFRPGDRSAARARLGIPQDAEVVLSIANLGLGNPLKDGTTARAAVQALAAQGRGRRVHWLIVGETGAAERQGDLHVERRGYVTDPAELAHYYRAADVFLHASRTELLPLVLTEALACELPVVAAAVGGTTELVIDGETGRTFAAGDVEAATRAVAWSLDHPADARARAVRGGEIIRAEYDARNVIDATLAWFEDAIEEDARRVGRKVGPIAHYGLRGAATSRAVQALRGRPTLSRGARWLNHRRSVALAYAGRTLRRLGLGA